MNISRKDYQEQKIQIEFLSVFFIIVLSVGIDFVKGKMIISVIFYLSYMVSYIIALLKVGTFTITRGYLNNLAAISAYCTPCMHSSA